MTEHEIIKKAVAEIFSKNGYTDLTRLTLRDYAHISHEIETTTRTIISGTTIKRLLHGEFSRLPQIATLNAISKYLGHKNWQEYKSSRSETDAAVIEVETNDNLKVESHKQPESKFKRLKIIAFVIILLSAITILGSIQFTDEATTDFSKVTFSAQTNTTNEIPNTVVFNYNVDEVKADSFFIQQSWDKNRKVKINKKNYTLTDIYYEPGYHTAKLIANDSVIRTVDISIPTDRWFLFAKDNSSSKPEYIKVSNMIKDGLFILTEKDLIANKIDLRNEKEYVYTFFPTKIEVSSDNFILKARLRMKEIRNNFCPYLMIEVFSQKNFTFFRSTSKGCASESSLQFGEKFISGKQNDLSSLGYDVTQWVNVELSVVNKQVKILFDGKEVFSTSYKNTSGLITGLGFISNGLCEIDYVELKGLDGRVVYQDDFDKKKDSRF